MKQITLILTLLIQTTAFAQKDSIPIVNKVDSLYDPFINLVYDRVVAFNFNYDTAKHRRLHRYTEFGNNLENFNYQSIRKFSIKTLDSVTTQDFIKIISDTSTYGQQYNDCFEPRLGLTFFSGNQEVFTVLICFDCGFLEASIPIPASLHSFYDIPSNEWDYQKQQPIENKPIFVRRYLKGFSKSGEEKLLNICKRLNMIYCKQ